jgi:hypothetical protein
MTATAASRSQSPTVDGKQAGQAAAATASSWPVQQETRA